VKFLWERPRLTVGRVAAVLGMLVLLDYDIGAAMVSGMLPLVRIFGGPS